LESAQLKASVDQSLGDGTSGERTCLKIDSRIFSLAITIDTPNAARATGILRVVISSHQVIDGAIVTIHLRLGLQLNHAQQGSLEVGQSGIGRHQATVESLTCGQQRIDASKTLACLAYDNLAILDFEINLSSSGRITHSKGATLASSAVHNLEVTNGQISCCHFKLGDFRVQSDIELGGCFGRSFQLRLTIQQGVDTAIQTTDVVDVFLRISNSFFEVFGDLFDLGGYDTVGITSKNRGSGTNCGETVQITASIGQIISNSRFDLFVGRIFRVDCIFCQNRGNCLDGSSVGQEVVLGLNSSQVGFQQFSEPGKTRQEVVKLALLAAERLLDGELIAKGGAWRIEP
jgi:hypothetical protein